MARTLQAREVSPGRYVVVDPDSATEAARRVRALIEQAEHAITAFHDIRDQLDRVRALLRGSHVAPTPRPNPEPDTAIPEAERDAWQ
jgi:hypothetical protein